MLGLIAIGESNYTIRSNRESGLGRYDIQFVPKSTGLPGIIIEIKSSGKNDAVNLKQLAQTALSQIEERKVRR